MGANDGTTDVTALAESMRSTFVLLAKDYLMGLAVAIPGVGPVALWFLKVFGGPVLDWVLTKLSTWAVMQAFFLNTAVRKASQAADYVDALTAKNNLPGNVSDADYEKAEQHEMDAFRNFVLLTN